MGRAGPGNPGGGEDSPEQHAIAVWAFLRGDCGGCIYVGSRKLVAVRTAAPFLRYSDSTTERSSPGAGAPATCPGKRRSASERDCCTASSRERCTGGAPARPAALAAREPPRA